MVKRYIHSFLNKNLNPNGFNIGPIDSLPGLSSDLELLISNSPGGWSIDKEVSKLLISLLLERKPTRVIEFGAGYSTLTIKYLFEESGNPYELISVEQNADWFKIPEPLNRLFSTIDISLTIAPVKFKIGYLGVYTRYELKDESIVPSGIELQVVDGPQYYFGREGGLDFTYDKLVPGALILMDDAERYTEKCVIYKWLKIYRGLELVYLNEKFGDKGLAILRVKSPLKRRFSLLVFVLGLYQGIKRFWNVKFGKGLEKRVINEC